jgi:hypothetical protein
MRSPRFFTIGVILVLQVLGNVADADSLLLETDDTWRAIGPLGDLSGSGINSVGEPWEGNNIGWNSQLSFDDSSAAGWNDAVFVFSNPRQGPAIWSDGTGRDGQSPAYFRKRFEVGGVPTSALLDLFVDDDAQIYINGSLVVNDSDGGATSLSDLVVASALVPGSNLIALKAHDSFGLLENLRVSLAVDFDPVPETNVVVLGNSGWQASWDSSLNPFVDVAVDAVTENAVFIQKTAEFIQGKVPAGFPTIPITFTQIKADAVKQIVINDEVITNSTGSDWTGFQFQLLDGNDVAFNPDMTNASAGGNGFSSSPFDNQIFGPDNQAYLVDGLGLSSGGGNAVIADGTQWFPGDGAHDGELYIDVVTGDGSLEDPFTVFTLKETPSFVPEPSTICLLVMGGLILLSSSTPLFKPVASKTQKKAR